jgi:hypothetical protein
MSTDSTELTFVRCPSCRSLVPAVSPRCRMCGATLDPSQRSEDSTFDQKKSNRVRQRTMSQPENELSETAGKIRDDEETESPAPAVTETQVTSQVPQGRDIDSMADPLSAYIEEVPVEEHRAQAGDAGEAGAVPGAEAPTEEAPPEVDSQGDNGAGSTSAVESLLSEPAVVEEPVKAAQVPAEPEPQALESKPMEAPKNEVKAAEEPQPFENKSRVIVESGQKRGGRSGLSFGRPRDEEQRGDRPKGQDRPGQGTSEKHAERVSGFPPPRRPEERRGSEHRQNDQRQNDHSGGDRQRWNERDRNRGSQPPPPAMHKEQEQRNQDRRPAEGEAHDKPKHFDPRRIEKTSARLFGWLVSFSNPDGVALELREGRFFISRSSLKPTDLIIDDQSISTPHALISVNTQGQGLRIQDLMSESGVYLRRKATDSYQRITDTAKLEHGDWIRFGEVEFQLTVAAHTGAK